MSKRQHRTPYRPRRKPASLVNRNPIAYLYAKDEIESRFRSLKIKIWVNQVGEEATDCLARLGWLIGLATETELKAKGITQRLRVLHGTLRMLHSWCLNGYTWQIQDPAGIEHALDLAHEVLMEEPIVAMQMVPGAEHFAQCIWAHKVTPDQITGAEIYQEEAEAA